MQHSYIFLIISSLIFYTVSLIIQTYLFFDWNMLLLFKWLRNVKMISFALDDKKLFDLRFDTLLVGSV